MSEFLREILESCDVGRGQWEPALAALEQELAAALKGWRGESSAVAHEQARRIAAEAERDRLKLKYDLAVEGMAARMAVQEAEPAEAKALAGDAISEVARLREALREIQYAVDEADYAAEGANEAHRIARAALADKEGT